MANLTFIRMGSRDGFIWGGFEVGLQGTCSQVPPAHMAHNTKLMIIHFSSNFPPKNLRNLDSYFMKACPVKLK